MGLERMNLNITAEEKKLLAYHEGGHATVAAILPHTDPLYKVTIIPRGRAMGVTQQLPEEKYVYSKDYILDRVAVMLGGRAAEELVFGTSTSGAESDLKQAVELARKMVLDWGMGEKLANLAFGGQRGQFVEGTLQQQAYSELTAEKIDHAVEGIIEESFTRAKNTLQDHREGLDRVAEVLMEKEMILGNEVMELIGVQKLL
jgi:cell division protease FtsH